MSLAKCSDAKQMDVFFGKFRINGGFFIIFYGFNMGNNHIKMVGSLKNHSMFDFKNAMNKYVNTLVLLMSDALLKRPVASLHRYL